ncbi:hypothetical protein D3C87_1100160 [compost metagenome]
MALDPSRVSRNIKRTVQTYLESVGIGAPILFDGRKPLPSDPAWVEPEWKRLNETELGNFEKQASWNLFLDCWSWRKADPFAGELDDLVDKLKAACRDKRVPLLDYSNPEDPQSTGYYVRLKLDGDDALDKSDRVQGRALHVTVGWLMRS